MNMAEIERKASRTARREHIQKYILAAVGVTGTLALAATAPNVARLFARKIENLPQLRVRTKSAAARLAKKGLIRFERRGDRIVLGITAAGRRALAVELEKKRAAKRRVWDGRYRIVAFDIPQSRKKQRDTLRRTVSSLGFLHLQHSVWLFPYDCEELVMLLKSELRLGRNVLYMIVSQIEDDAWIRRHFKLPQR